MPMATLALQHLEKQYDGRKVVKGVSLNVDSGQVIGLLGPNGAGKTTTFYMTVGMVRPNKGKVTLDDARQRPLSSTSGMSSVSVS